MRSLEARGSRATLAAVSERRLEARQIEAHIVCVGEFDQAAEPPRLLGLVVDEDFGEAGDRETDWRIARSPS